MSDNTTDDNMGFVLEHLDDQLKAILEGQGALKDVPSAIARLQEDMDEVKTDIKAIKAAVTDQTGQLNGHENRLTSLEEARA